MGLGGGREKPASGYEVDVSFIVRVVRDAGAAWGYWRVAKVREIMVPCSEKGLARGSTATLASMEYSKLMAEAWQLKWSERDAS